MSQGLDHSLKNNGGKSLLVDYNLLTIPVVNSQKLSSQ